MTRALIVAHGIVTYLVHEPTAEDRVFLWFIHRSFAAWRAHVDRP